MSLDPRLDRVVCVGNQKGGVGKTSVVTNIAGLMAKDGVQVLALDLDPQGDLTKDLLGNDRLEQNDGGEFLLSAVSSFKREIPLTAVSARPGLDLICGGPSIKDVVSMLIGQNGQRVRERFGHALADLAADYDIVLLDLPPMGDALVELALTYSHFLVIPTRSDDRSIDGMIGMVERVSNARQHNPGLHLLGVVLVASGTQQRRLRNGVMTGLGEDLGPERLCTSVIRYAESAAHDARARGLLLHELMAAQQDQPAWYELRRNGGDRTLYSTPESVAALAEDYKRLSHELLGRMADVLTSPVPA